MKITAETFKNVAARKGVEISLNAPQEIRLDMNMIETSLEMAIQNVSNEQIKLRLQRLKQTGTDAQKVDFVMSDSDYYFPEDIEMLAGRSRENSEPPICFRFCEVTYYVVCSFSQGEEICRDKAKRICTIHCE